MILPEEDIKRLKSAYLNNRRTVTLSDGREIVRREQYRFNSCRGCIFAHSVGCFCRTGEVWISKKEYEDENEL